MKRYQNGPYSVEIQMSGAIMVKRGDWLSKYSWAIHQDLFQVHEYGRINRLTGKMEPIREVDKLVAGETIYHLPTWQVESAEMVIVVPFTKEEKKEIADKILKDKDHDLPNLGTNTAIKWVRGGQAVVGGLQAVLITTAAAPVLAIISPIVATIGAVLSFASAWQTTEQIAAMHGAVYGTVAWIFDDPRPGGIPYSLMKSYREHPLSKSMIDGCVKAWNRGVTEGYNGNISQKICRGGKVSKAESDQNCKVIIQRSVSGDPKVLQRILSEEFAKKYLTSEAVRTPFLGSIPEYKK